MPLLFVSFIAGVLTVLAPCVLPLLPIIIGGSVQGKAKRNPYVIALSLSATIVIFTLLLKFSTLFINVPQSVWSIISGVIIIIFGLISVFPNIWTKINVKLNLSTRSDNLLNKSAKTHSWWSDIVLGCSLGPVFSSCSPTYFLILATVLPRSLTAGIIYLLVYALGLSLVLMLVSILGQRFIRNARWAADPNGWFKRGLGILFLIVGIFILTGTDKKIQTFLVEKGYYNVSNLEQNLLKNANPENSPQVEPSTDSSTPNAQSFPLYREITNPSGFVNSDPFTIKQLVGKKIILVDFMTYSCINCIRTFPYLNAWYDKYKDQGLEIVAIHTPEFAFEHKIENVREAIQRFGIKFPVVLDNNYATWNAYGNSYWPRKYLIDINGRIVYDHIGEGMYDETEKKIQELLKEKMTHDNTPTASVPNNLINPIKTSDDIEANSPETYFGSGRNEFFVNGQSGIPGIQNLTIPSKFNLNELNLGGTWNFVSEYAENTTASAKILYRYNAKAVYLVSSATKEVKIKVLLDGKPLSQKNAGTDVKFENGESYMIIKEERLYSIIQDQRASEHTLELQIEGQGLKAYTFTFG
jgi:cytochrome c biogenesis protein CcdA/thiol-disulfide isomerase/thioredoxin